ncbi:protein S100-A5 isoform X3 [Vulpes lagopus]|uniref:protein S100-A5 isoform X3 n=1 Tax=Vulpes lagopus TaxID=494514 RepID=UPI001BCA6450|nr:protein S100-A5 isoform X3 [Vulpes lagopus]
MGHEAPGRPARARAGHPPACLAQLGLSAGTDMGTKRIILLECEHKKMKESGIDDLMRTLDKNSDQEIDFKEYTVFLTTLCMAYNDFFLEEDK